MKQKVEHGNPFKKDKDLKNPTHPLIPKRESDEIAEDFEIINFQPVIHSKTFHEKQEEQKIEEKDPV